MKVSFEGIGESVVTFYNSDVSGKLAGMPVKITGDSEVGSCSDGERFFGVSLSDGGEFAAVQIKGFVEVSCSGDLPDPGFALLSADGLGGVREDNINGGEFLVITVDSANNIIGIML